MPGRFDRERLLALELAPGALNGACGMIGAAGQVAPTPDLAAFAAQDRRSKRARARLPHAA